MIEWYDTFNNKGCLDELIFGDFNEQPNQSNYYNVLNYDDDDGNNIPGNTFDDDQPFNEGVEDAVMQKYEDINNEIKIDYDDRLAS